MESQRNAASSSDRLSISMLSSKSKRNSSLFRPLLSCTAVICIAATTHFLLKFAYPMLKNIHDVWVYSPFVDFQFSWFQSSAQQRLPRVLADAPTDDGAQASHFSLFGGISSLDIMIASISVIIIVGAVQCIEYLFHTLHLITHDTPFNQMVQSIEKELMVVGFTAFIFKIVVNTTDFLDLEWFHCLEYAGK